MPRREEESALVAKQSPLQTAIKEGETFKKEVDEFVKACQEAQKDTDLENSAIAVKNLYKKSNELLEEHARLQRQAEELTKENETSKVMRYDSKKKDELKRLDKLKEKIDKYNKLMAPDEVEEDYLKSATKEGIEVEESEEETESEDEETEEATPPKASTSKGGKAVVEEEDEETDDEDDEDLEDEEESEEEEEDSEEEETDEEEESESDAEEEETYAEGEEHQGDMRQFVALQDYDVQQAGDLGFREGDILTITNARSDGWLEAKDSDGNIGLVPSNFLKVYSKFDAEEEDEEESDDDGDPKTPRSGRQLWKNIKRAVKETSVTDVLHAMGSLPAGFRETTLGKMVQQDTYTMINYLAPKLSPSCVSFRDLFFDATSNKIRARSARIQRIVTIMSARQIPLPGTAGGIEVLSRHVRVCLFDGKNVLSNIHTIRIQGLDKTQNTWNFNIKVTEGMKTLEFADFFIRSNSSEGNLGILFELGLSYVRTSTQQEGEFSCGWVHLPLFDANGAPAQNKTYDLFVNGGTPYEKGVDVDPSVGRRASTNLFRSLMSGNRQPRLSIRLAAPTKEQKDLLDTLPDVCVSSTAYIQYLSFYRQILTDAVIRDRVEPRCTDLIHNPLLASFPTVADLPDIMDVLRMAWAERLKTAKRTEKVTCFKLVNLFLDGYALYPNGTHDLLCSLFYCEDEKDHEALKQLYVKVYMDTVYPLIHSASIPPVKFGDPAVEKERVKEIQRLQKLAKDKKGAAGVLLSAEASYTPFDTREMSFNVIGPHCTSRQ